MQFANRASRMTIAFYTIQLINLDKNQLLVLLVSMSWQICLNWLFSWKLIKVTFSSSSRLRSRFTIRNVERARVPVPLSLSLSLSLSLPPPQLNSRLKRTQCTVRSTVREVFAPRYGDLSCLWRWKRWRAKRLREGVGCSIILCSTLATNRASRPRVEKRSGKFAWTKK